MTFEEAVELLKKWHSSIILMNMKGKQHINDTPHTTVTREMRKNRIVYSMHRTRV